MHANVKKEVTRAPEEAGSDFDRAPNTETYTNLYEQRPSFRYSEVDDNERKCEKRSYPGSRRGLPQFRHRPRNSKTYTNLYEQRPPANSKVRVTSTNSISWLWGSKRGSSDEAHFWLNGYVNKQNCRIWREDNPQVYVETPLQPEKLIVWRTLWAGGILLQKR
ncbi:hypothetical protein TNCV_2324401 [Trichonephila clavipes]|nr:hypothetical protein TNCV_2324401 [Trichonephila clavipes]